MARALKFALNQNTFPQTDTITFLKLARKYGFKAVELSMDRLTELLSCVSVGTLQKTIAETGLVILTLNAFNESYMTPLENRDLLKADCGKISLLCKFACVRAIVIPAANIFPFSESSTGFEENFDLQLSNLQYMVDTFSAAGIESAIEPVGYGSYSFTRLKQADALVRKVEGNNRISIVPDVHLQYCAGDSPKALWDLSVPVQVIHFNDSLKTQQKKPHFIHDRTLPGEGAAICYPWVDAALSAGFSGYFSLEVFSKEVSEMDAEAAVALCRQKLDTFEANYFNRKQEQ